jgi:hypothetical protein
MALRQRGLNPGRSRTNHDHGALSMPGISPARRCAVFRVHVGYRELRSGGTGSAVMRGDAWIVV